MERETGFEPATSTLARLRSTSWAILALLENTYSFYLENEDSQTIFNMRRVVKIIKFLCMIFAMFIGWRTERAWKDIMHIW